MKLSRKLLDRFFSRLKDHDENDEIVSVNFGSTFQEFNVTLEDETELLYTLTTSDSQEYRVTCYRVSNNGDIDLENNLLEY